MSTISPGREGVFASAPARHRPLSYLVRPVMAADNKDIVVHPDDRKYGQLAIGGQGSGKSSLLLRMYLNDIWDPNAAVILMDPKTRLAERALELTPLQCGKRVWYLNLGDPAFGMSPLRLTGNGTLEEQVSAIAANLGSAFEDLFQGQVYQSSKRYLVHAVIGALSIAQIEGRLATFSDVFNLLTPHREDLRERAVAACQNFPDLVQTLEFFRDHMPAEISAAPSAVYQRTDPPRNKIESILGPPAMRRFFDARVDVSIREIVEARDILIVDAAMDKVGEENSVAVMHFVMWMLHAQLQRQVRMPADERARVALIADEAYHIASSENIVNQIATHREAGLDVTFGLQYMAQIGAGSQQYGEKILKGIKNLLQTRYFFRIGDALDAEEASRIGMAVYQTMIRSDPESRAQMRVYTESLLNLANHWALVSPITLGSRAPAMYAKTYPMPENYPDTWMRWHLERQRRAINRNTPTVPSDYDTLPLDLSSDTVRHVLASHPERPSTNGTTPAPAPKGAAVEAAPQPTAMDDLDAALDAPRPSAVNGAEPAAVADHPAAAATADQDPPQAPDAPAPSEPVPPSDEHPVEQTATDPEPATSAPGADQAAPVTQPQDSPVAEPSPAPSAPVLPATGRAPSQASTPAAAVDASEPAAGRKVVQPIFRPETEAPELQRSAVRRIVATSRLADDQGVVFGHARPDGAPDPQLLRDVAFVDQVIDVSPPESKEPKPDVPRLTDQDFSALVLLDRVGVVLSGLLHAGAYPNLAERSARSRLSKLYDEGLVARHTIKIREGRGALPYAYSLTKRGFWMAQERDGSPIPKDRKWREPKQERGNRLGHDTHTLGWVLALHRLLGAHATDDWVTPAYSAGHLHPPMVGKGRTAKKARRFDIPLGSGVGIFDVTVDEFGIIRPDARVEARIKSRNLSFDILVEMDRTARPSYNIGKFAQYDAFLLGWYQMLSRYKNVHRGNRPIVIFVAPDAYSALSLAKAADETMIGHIGAIGAPAEEHYYPGREHTFFAVAEDIYHGSPAVLAFDPFPPAVRERTTGTSDVRLQRVALLPEKVLEAGQRQANHDD